MAPGPRDRGFFVPPHPGLPDANGLRAATPPIRGSTRVSSAPPCGPSPSPVHPAILWPPVPAIGAFLCPHTSVCPTRTGLAPRPRRFAALRGCQALRPYGPSPSPVHPAILWPPVPAIGAFLCPHTPVCPTRTGLAPRKKREKKGRHTLRCAGPCWVDRA